MSVSLIIGIVMTVLAVAWNRRKAYFKRAGATQYSNTAPGTGSLPSAEQVLGGPATDWRREVGRHSPHPDPAYGLQLIAQRVGGPGVSNEAPHLWPEPFLGGRP